MAAMIVSSAAAVVVKTFTLRRRQNRRILCVGWASHLSLPSTFFGGGNLWVLSSVLQDPEGILGPPQRGHIARLDLKRRLEKDAVAREAFDRQLREEREQRRKRREARVVPETTEGLIEYFLDTEARDIEVEIGRLRPRLNKEFFDHLRVELGQLRFAVNRTTEMEDRLIELEAMQKVLQEGTGSFSFWHSGAQLAYGIKLLCFQTDISFLYIVASEAYDKMQTDLVSAKQRLMKILQSKDRKSTLLEMVERNELSRSILALLDENIASAISNNQKEAAAFMEDVRSTILKYMTV
ncbi:hypothetical protein C4D60_Mb11t20290 [Musa balbisiana]|uniref:Uncharacterized protein n=1 Tax=Musa balbisiana TaxID=52838 RepID=A0A4S8J5J6_MUSBA|nr:hypothetical protein C4D60_Mb11t20290 [Musa balbisiana]